MRRCCVEALIASSSADSGLAQQVRDVNQQINHMERDFDEECIRIFARRVAALHIDAASLSVAGVGIVSGRRLHSLQG